MTAQRQQPRTLNPETGPSSRNCSEAPRATRLHETIFYVFTAMNKEQGAQAIERLQDYQGACLKQIYQIVGMQLVSR